MIDNNTTYSLKNPVILGWGKTGLSFAHFLKNQGIEQFTVMDTRGLNNSRQPNTETFSQATLITGGLNTEIMQQASVLLASPGVALTPLRKIAHMPAIISDIELFATCAKAPIVGVTGSNGKSTVVTLLGEMAKKAGIHAIVAGNIGTPVLNCLNLPIPDYYILELSSFQLEVTYQLNAYASVLLNLSEDHMDRYPHFSAYVKAKQRLYQQSKHWVINADQPLCWEGVVNQRHALSFSTQGKQGLYHLEQRQNQLWLYRANKPLISLSKCSLTAQHQCENMLAALALGEIMKLDRQSMLNTLTQFRGLAHRCQHIFEHNQVAWYNDSKATNVASAVAAIQSLGTLTQGQLIWLAGGQDKGADFTPLTQLIKDYVKVCILFSQNAKQIEKALPKGIPIIHTDSLDNAVSIAALWAKPLDTVLFSPACASFDMFANFEVRGEQFEKAVLACHQTYLES